MPFKARGEETMSSYSFYRAPNIHEPPTWLSEVENSEWNKRGWTFQERLVSRRVLHFADHKVYFECRSADTNEQGHGSRPTIFDSTSFFNWYKSRLLGFSEYFLSQEQLDIERVYKTYYNLASAYF